MSYTKPGEGKPAKRTVRQFRRCAAAAVLGAVVIVSGGSLVSSAASASTHVTDRQVVPDDLIESTLGVRDENRLTPFDSTAEDQASPTAPDGEDLEPEQLAGQHLAPSVPEPGRTGQSGASQSASPAPEMVSSGAGNTLGAESLSVPADQKQVPEQAVADAPGTGSAEALEEALHAGAYTRPVAADSAGDVTRVALQRLPAVEPIATAQGLDESVLWGTGLLVAGGTSIAFFFKLNKRTTALTP
jgi:hypothetical protein